MVVAAAAAVPSATALQAAGHRLRLLSAPWPACLLLLHQISVYETLDIVAASCLYPSPTLLIAAAPACCRLHCCRRCCLLQPWRSFKPDGVILFSDILTPLPGIGVSFEIDDNKGPLLDDPIRSADQVCAGWGAVGAATATGATAATATAVQPIVSQLLVSLSLEAWFAKCSHHTLI